MVLPGNFHDGNPCEEGKKEKEVGRWRMFPVQLGCFNMPKVKRLRKIQNHATMTRKHFDILLQDKTK